jgi:hypothetical protein
MPEGLPTPLYLCLICKLVENLDFGAAREHSRNVEYQDLLAIRSMPPSLLPSFAKKYGSD